MADFIGEDAAGLWTLTLTDGVVGNPATINAWSVAVTLLSSDEIDLLADLNMRGNRITNVAEPEEAGDAATREFVESAIADAIGDLGLPDNYCYVANGSCAAGFTRQSTTYSFNIGYNTRGMTMSISPDGDTGPSMSMSQSTCVNCNVYTNLNMTLCCRRSAKARKALRR